MKHWPIPGVRPPQARADAISTLRCRNRSLPRSPHATAAHTLAPTAEAFLSYLGDVKYRPANTVPAYRSDLRGAAAVLTLPLNTIMFKDIERYIASTETAASTRQRKSAALAAFFRLSL